MQTAITDKLFKWTHTCTLSTF